MKAFSIILGRLCGRRPTIAALSSSSASSLTGTAVASSAAATYCTLALSDDVYKPLFNAAVLPSLSYYSPSPSSFFVNHSRGFSSAAAASGPSKMVTIETEEQLNDSLRKAQDESLPAIFYFTAVWCGPCKLISPYIGQLSEKYPHVATYKIDIDKEALATSLGKLNINAVPTVQFFHKGKKASEVVGADVNKLSATMEELYK